MAVLPVATGTNAGRAVAVLLVGAAWLIAFALGRVDLAAVPGALRVALGLGAGAVALAALVSPYAGRALTWGSIGYAGAPVWIAFIVIVAGVAATDAVPRRRTLVAAAVGWVAIALVVALVDLASGRPVASVFNTTNTAAVVLVAAFPLVAWLASDATTLLERTLWGAAAAALAASIVATGSAAGVLGLLVTFGVLLMAVPGVLGLRTPHVLRPVRLAAGLAAVLLVAGVGLGMLVPSALPAPLGAFLSDEVLGATFTTRLEMWNAAAGVVSARPLLGTGPDTFHLAAQPYLSARLFESESVGGIAAVPPDPHSWIASTAVSFGLVGLIALLAAAGIWARLAFASPSGEAPEGRSMRRAAAAGTIGAFAVLLFVPWAIITGALVCACAGLAVGPAGDTRAESPRPAPVPRAAAGVLAFVFTALAVLLVAGLVAFDAGQNADDARAAGAAYDRSARLLPTYPYPRFRSLHATGSQLGGSAETLAAWRARVESEPSVDEDATFALVLVRDALDQAYRWGRSDLAWEEALLSEAADRFPNGPDAALERAHLAVLRGDVATARAALEGIRGAATFDSRYGLYRYYLAVLEGDPAAPTLRAELEAEFGPRALLEPQ